MAGKLRPKCVKHVSCWICCTEISSSQICTMHLTFCRYSLCNWERSTLDGVVIQKSTWRYCRKANYCGTLQVMLGTAVIPEYDTLMFPPAYVCSWELPLNLKHAPKPGPPAPASSQSVQKDWSHKHRSLYLSFCGCTIFICAANVDGVVASAPAIPCIDISAQHAPNDVA